MEFPTLGEQVQSCQKVFLDVLSLSHYMGAATQHALQEQSQLFDIWTVNTNVLRRSRFSLEYRLREAPYVEGMIREVLTSTRTTLTRLYESLCALNSTSGMSQASDDHFNSPSDEILEAVLDMLSSDMRLLQQMARRIRLASTMKQNREASDRSHCDDDESKAYKEYARATIIDRHCKKAEENIKDRLALAMLIRRYRMIYRRKRHKDTVLLESGIEITKEKRLKPREHIKRARPPSAGFRTYASGAQTLGAASTVFSHTESDRTGTKVNEARYRQLSSPSISQGPRGMGIELKADYPPRPEVTGAQPCPYCSMLLSPLDVASEEAWIKHVREDLEPFICLYKDCQLSRDELLFDTSAQWIEHMQEAHLTKWRCRPHRERYDTRDEMIRHLREEHAGGFRTEEELDLLVDDSARPFGSLFEECPLCPVSKSGNPTNLEIHISEHLISLASKSIQLADRWEQILATNEHDTGPIGSPDSHYSASSIAQKARSTILHAAGHYPEPIPDPEHQMGPVQDSAHTSDDEVPQEVDPKPPSWSWNGTHQVSSRDWIGGFDLVIDTSLCQIDLSFLEDCISRRPGDNASAHEHLRLCQNDVCGHRTSPIPSGSMDESARVRSGHQYFRREVALHPHDHVLQQGKQDAAGVTEVASSHEPKRHLGRKLSQEGHEGLSTPKYTSNTVSGNARVQFGDQYIFGDYLSGKVVQPFHDSSLTQDIRRSSYVEEMVASLGFDDMNSRRLAIGCAQTKTCQWILTSTEYRSWCDMDKLSEHHGTLWLKGKPGSGKSTAMKFLYDDARKAPDEIVISFFFNASGRLLERSVEGMYRSLLYQLFEEVPHLQTDLKSRLQKKAGQAWTTAALQDLFSHAVLSLGSMPLVCYIDALDESKEDDVRDLINFLQQLTETTLSQSRRLFVCLSSRHYPHITMRRSLQIVLEDQKEHDNDIAEYIRANLNIHEAEIAEQIQSRSSGVFLWVVLVVKMLNERFDRGESYPLYALLKTIPPGLSALYQRMASEVPMSKRTYFVNILQWLQYAHRTLRCSELYHAVLCTTFASDSSIDVCNNGDMARFLVDCSGGLAKVSRGIEPAVQFIHETVRDFFIREGGMTMLESASSEKYLPGHCHDCLKSCCMRYIIAAERDVANGLEAGITSHDQAQARREKLLKQRPFLQYALKGIFYHGELAQSYGIGQEDFIRDFPLSALVNVWNTLEQDPSRQYNSSVELAYILVDNDAFHLLQAELRQNKSLTRVMSGELGKILLRVAIARNNENIIALLLDKGATVYSSALAEACASGSLATIKLLLEHGADIESVAGEYPQTPLQITINEERTDIVEFLLSAGADPNGALTLAIDFGNERIVDLLLKTGADPNASDILQVASSNGHDKIVRLLLEWGADPNGALGNVVSSGNEEIESGADPNVGDGEILGSASTKGYEKIVQMLPSHDAEVNSQAHYGRGLTLAAGLGHESIVRLLLEHGADIHAGGGDILKAASSNGHDKLVRLLLEWGADVSAGGGDILKAASSNGHETIVQLLLEWGADVNAGDGNALRAASSNGYEKIVQLLLACGANVNAGGGDILQAASSKGHEKVVQLLLGYGAARS